MRTGMNRRLSLLEDRVQAYVEASEASKVAVAEARDLVCFLAQFMLDSGTVSLPHGYDDMPTAERLQWWSETFAQSQGSTALSTARLCIPRTDEQWAECRDRKYRLAMSRCSWGEGGGWETELLADDRYAVCNSLFES
jgi:hypothetical protein